MKIFLFWLCGILLALAGSLAFLWWHPRRRSRFQVRLTAIFLLFALVPTVPLIFLVSTLATNTADVLLVPQVEMAMLQAVAALKAQCEATGKRFALTFAGEGFTPEAFSRAGLDYYFIWQREGETLRLAAEHARDARARQQGLAFGAERMGEIWGQTGSELNAWQNHSTPPSDSILTGHCRVWLPRGENEMAVLGYAIAPEVIAAKTQLTQTMRIYNALTLIKEKALQDQLMWAAAAAVVLILVLLSVFLARGLSRPCIVYK